MRLLPELLLALATVAAPAVACESAENTARAFFRDDYSFAFKDPTGLRTAIAPELRSLLAAEAQCKRGGETCAIDWDPWTSAQDGDIEGSPKFSLLAQTHTNARVRVALRLRAGEGPLLSRNTTLVLTRSARMECWAVSDLEMGTRGSLRKLLTLALPKR